MEQSPLSGQLTNGEKIERALALKNEGNECFKANDTQTAIRKYHNALMFVKGLDSRFATLQSVGADCTGPGNEDVSEEERQKIKELQFTCHNNLAASLLKKEKYERALDNAKKALEIEPENIKALFRKGTAQFYLQNYHDAEQDFKKVLQLNPTEKAVQKYMKQIEIYKEKALQKQKQMYSKMF